MVLGLNKWLFLVKCCFFISRHALDCAINIEQPPEILHRQPPISVNFHTRNLPLPTGLKLTNRHRRKLVITCTHLSFNRRPLHSQVSSILDPYFEGLDKSKRNAWASKGWWKRTQPWQSCNTAVPHDSGLGQMSLSTNLELQNECNDHATCWHL